MAEPELFPSGMEHYQHHVLDNLVATANGPKKCRYTANSVQGFETLQLLESALNACR